MKYTVRKMKYYLFKYELLCLVSTKLQIIFLLLGQFCPMPLALVCFLSVFELFDSLKDPKYKFQHFWSPQGEDYVEIGWFPSGALV